VLRLLGIQEDAMQTVKTPFGTQTSH